MSADYTRYFREDDIGLRDPGKLNETVGKEKLQHAAGVRAYDPAKMNPVARFFAGICGWTVDFTDSKGNTVALGRRSLEAYMVRNKIIDSRADFDPKTAEELLNQYLQIKDLPVPTEADIRFDKEKLVLSKTGLGNVFDAIGIKPKARDAVTKAFSQANGKYEISKKELFEKLEEVSGQISSEAARDIPKELRPIRDRFVQFVMSHDPKLEEKLQEAVGKVLHAAPAATPPPVTPVPVSLELGDLKDFATFQLKIKAGAVWTNASIESAIHRLSLHTKKDAYPQRTHVRDLHQVAAYLWIRFKGNGGWDKKCKIVFNEMPLIDKAIVIWCAKQPPQVDKPIDPKVVEGDRKILMSQLVSHFAAATDLNVQESERKQLMAFLDTHEKGKELKAEFEEVLKGQREGVQTLPEERRAQVLQATAKEFGIK